MEESGILPQRKRQPAIFAVIYKKDDGSTQIMECDSKAAAKQFIVTLDDPNSVVKVYKVSETIQLKQRVVYSL